MEAFFLSAVGCLDVFLYGLMHILSFTFMDRTGQKVALLFKEDLFILFELGETVGDSTKSYKAIDRQVGVSRLVRRLEPPVQKRRRQ